MPFSCQNKSCWLCYQSAECTFLAHHAWKTEYFRIYHRPTAQAHFLREQTECYLTIAQLMTSVTVQINEASTVVHFIYFFPLEHERTQLSYAIKPILIIFCMIKCNILVLWCTVLKTQIELHNMANSSMLIFLLPSPASQRKLFSSPRRLRPFKCKVLPVSNELFIYFSRKTADGNNRPETNYTRQEGISF